MKVRELQSSENAQYVLLALSSDRRTSMQDAFSTRSNFAANCDCSCSCIETDNLAKSMVNSRCCSWHVLDVYALNMPEQLYCSFECGDKTSVSVVDKTFVIVAR